MRTTLSQKIRTVTWLADRFNLTKIAKKKYFRVPIGPNPEVKYLTGIQLESLGRKEEPHFSFPANASRFDVLDALRKIRMFVEENNFDWPPSPEDEDPSIASVPAGVPIDAEILHAAADELERWGNRITEEEIL